MPTLNVNGQRVTVDDSFLKMSPEQQNATVDEIAKSLKTPKAPSSGGGISEGLSDIIRSAPQAILRGLYAGAQSNPLTGNPFARFTEGGRYLQEQADRPAAALPQPQTSVGRYGSAAIEALSNPMSYAGPGGLGLKLGSAALSGIGAQAGSDLTRGSTLGSIVGGITGAVLPGGAARAARRLNAPTPIKSPERAANVKILRDEGIEPSAGDVSGRQGVRVAEEMGNRIGGGGSYDTVKDKPLRQLSQAVTERMGDRVERATPEVLERTRERIGNGLEQVARDLPIKHDASLTNDFTNLATEVTNNAWLSDELRTAVNKQIDAILNGFVTKTVKGKVVAEMDGKTYQGLTRHDTPLGRAMRSTDDNVAHYANKIRSMLDDAMERSAHARGTRQGVGRRQALVDLKELRRQWYNMLIISKSVAGPGEAAAEGTILPERLGAVMRAGADNKMAYAAGRSDLHKLARAAQAVITPARHLDWTERAKIHAVPGSLFGAAGMLAGGPSGAAIGGLAGGAAPGLIGRAVNSEIGQRILKRQPSGPAPDAHLWASALRGGAVGASHKRKEKPKQQLYE